MMLVDPRKSTKVGNLCTTWHTPLVDIKVVAGAKAHFLFTPALSEPRSAASPTEVGGFHQDFPKEKPVSLR
jgi:hypothetical protein